MHQYLRLARHCLSQGVDKSDRTGTGTRSVFGYQMRFDLAREFPIVTAKRTHFKGVVAELLWFLSGSTRVQDLRDLGSTIWDEWERPDGTIGPMYGYQWRGWRVEDVPYVQEGYEIDQIQALLDGLRNDPDSRRHIVSAWNVADLPDMALAPCHAMFQCYCQPMNTHERVAAYEAGEGREHYETYLSQMAEKMDELGVPKYRLSLQVYQRSADVFLGVPFNIASYALLTHMLAQQCGYAVGELIWTGGDCHLYHNHIDQAVEMLQREPVPGTQLAIARKPDDLFSYRPDDFSLVGYNPHPGISAPVAV